MYRKIMVGLDGSDASEKALLAALDIARACGIAVHALGVEEHLPHFAATIGEVEEAKRELDTRFDQVMEKARHAAEEYGVAISTEVCAGNVALQLLRVSREGEFDLIVLGAKGHSVIRDFLLGTTTDRVTHHASCSVLVVR